MQQNCDVAHEIHRLPKARRLGNHEGLVKASPRQVCQVLVDGWQLSAEAVAGSCLSRAASGLPVGREVDAQDVVVATVGRRATEEVVERPDVYQAGLQVGVGLHLVLCCLGSEAHGAQTSHLELVSDVRQCVDLFVVGARRSGHAQERTAIQKKAPASTAEPTDWAATIGRRRTMSGKETEHVPEGLPPANWYPDPADGSQWRYWDGTAWTEHFAPRGGEVVVTAAAVRVTRMTRKKKKSAIPSLADFVATARLEPPRQPLDEQVEVAGETYYSKGIKGVFREAGMPITENGNTIQDLQCILVPEPWNPHDPNAVAVMIGQHQVGHLPADLACDYAEPLAELATGGVLATGVARVWALDDGGIIRARVTLLIPEADQF